MAASAQPRLAVLIPCRNEEAAIATVVADFRAALPTAIVYVYDNNSVDRTAARARAAGAVVRFEARQGKGHVVRRMFADVEADVFVLVDGDGTYDAMAAGAMVRRLLLERLDMVTGVRIPQCRSAYRSFHRLGNRALTRVVGAIFGDGVSDLLSGYRVLSRRFVKSFPALAAGFETETEITVHALALRMAIGEVATKYRPRPQGSASKLRTWADALRILRTIVVLVREERPLPFYLSAAAVLLFAGAALGVPVVGAFLRTGLVPRLPTALLATGMVLLASICVASGLILDSAARGRREFKRLTYLAIAPWPIAA